MAVDLGFHHFILDLREEFGEAVIDNFVDEYLAGRTPNPCILCNTHIKWNALLRRADALDCEKIATGHYARIQNAEGRYFISRARDLNKDQSYVLWGLSQECMARTLFPLEELLKPEVREIAFKRGYTDLSKKAESYEICFIPDNDYRGFLLRKQADVINNLSNGLFIDMQGNVIGKHHGYPFFTIGQRKGLGMAFGKPMFVAEIRPETNTVVLAEEHELGQHSMQVQRLNWQKQTGVSPYQELITKIRYKDPGHISTVEASDTGLIVRFLAPVNGIAPGQSAVVYDGEDIVCGGLIARARL